MKDFVCSCGYRSSKPYELDRYVKYENMENEDGVATLFQSIHVVCSLCKKDSVYATYSVGTAIPNLDQYN